VLPGEVLPEDLLRDSARRVLGALLRRGADFSIAEDAVQEALLEATEQWPRSGVPAEPTAWLTTVARRKLIDMVRAESARRRREDTVAMEPDAGPTEQSDDTLHLLFPCCHPALSPAAAIALTLRAVGGLTTREIATAYLVPEATIAQRISRAKRIVAEQRFDAPGDVSTVLRILYLMFNEGYTSATSRIDVAAEAIRLARLLQAETDDPEVAGLLALMVLHHARRAARFDEHGTVVPLDHQDRSRWDRDLIADGVRILTAALQRGQLGHGRRLVA